MVTPRERKILDILFDGETHVSQIALKRGSPDNIKADLEGLVQKNLIKKRIDGNRHYYSLTSEGARKVLLSDRSALAKTLKKLDLVLSGKLTIAGPFEEYLRPDGSIKNLYVKDPKTGRKRQVI